MGWVEGGLEGQQEDRRGSERMGGIEAGWEGVGLWEDGKGRSGTVGGWEGQEWEDEVCRNYDLKRM